MNDTLMNSMNMNPMEESLGEVRLLDIRICRICQEVKNSTEFVRNKAFKSGIDTICLSCSREKVKLWRKLNPEKRAAQLKRESPKEYNHNKHLKATYGITRVEYLEMFDEQEGCCKICRRHQLDFKKRLSVDHCHTTGKVRGLLCSNCNSLLGNSRDEAAILQAAIEYLREHHG